MTAEHPNVTVVYHARIYCTRWIATVRSDHGGEICVPTADGNSSFYSVNNEGITWIRGHVSASSAEGRALLAAFALVFG